MNKLNVLFYFLCAIAYLILLLKKKPIIYIARNEMILLR